MADIIEYSTVLTEGEFSPENYRRGRKARVVCDALGKTVCSVSDKYLFDLRGKEIAELRFKEKRPDKDGNKTVYAEYASESRLFRIIGDRLYEATTPQKYIGSIVRDRRNIFNIVVLSALAVILSVTIALIALINPPASETVIPVIEVSDSDGEWSTREIAVFDGKIQPGSFGEYQFVLNNPHDLEMAYSFYIEPKYEGEIIPAFPILFRIKMNNVILQTEEWRTVDKLEFEDLNILPNARQSFTLEWNWPFESGMDGNDTAIGSDGGKISIALSLIAQAR